MPENNQPKKPANQGRTTPTVSVLRRERFRAEALGLNLRRLMTSRTLLRVASLICGLLFRTFETVASETPASRQMSVIVIFFIPQAADLRRFARESNPDVAAACCNFHYFHIFVKRLSTILFDVL